MRHVSCDLCGADETVLLGERPPRTDVLHARFVRCARCQFVYADPRAEEEEAERFYSAVGARGSGSLEHDTASQEWRRAVAARKAHLERMSGVVRSVHEVRFLDVGFGDGSALAAAHDLGWKAHGLELADWLVEAAERRLPYAEVALGDVAHSDLEAGSFDVIYAWHVVEHVLDIRAWLAAVTRLLRDGGVLVLGTESADALYGRLFRLGFRALRRTPWPPTSTDHTYWFSAATLVALLERAGLEVMETSVYENSPIALIRDETRARLRNPRWALHFVLYLVSALAASVRPRLGGKLWAAATKSGVAG
jgi:2-polyprenyl-3-methyl-5-hydroxy-6-metoxy-1,4-benzoquinol methylase